MKLTSLILAAALTAAPALAGGPVIIEDTAEPEPQRNVVPWIIGAGIVLAIIATGSGGCFQPEPEPTPEPQPGGC